MLPKSSWPFYEKKTISKVSNCLKSGKVNYHTGFNCKKFELMLLSIDFPDKSDDIY